MVDTTMTLATGYIRPRTTSLFYDRLVICERNLIYRCLDSSDDFYDLYEFILFFPDFFIIPEKITYELSIISDLQYLKHLPRHPETQGDYLQIESSDLSEKDYAQAGATYEIMALINLHKNLNVTPIYPSPLVFKGDKSLSVPFVIKMIPQIIETNLRWEQVLDMREDKASISKLRRFKNWMYDLEGKNEEQISLHLETALDDYKFALKKHGILTSTGAMTTIFSAGSTIVGALTGSQLELLMAGLVATGGAVAYTAKQTINLMEQKRAPIAFVYDVIEKAVQA